jgi:hypothetical protein
MILIQLILSIEISHWFTAKENDWGYVNYITFKVRQMVISLDVIELSLLKDLMSKESGFVKNGAVTLTAKISADAPHGIK